MSGRAIVEAKNLTKYYGKRRGIEGVSFTLNQNEVVGFLGPNGSGKTTVLRMLIGLISITSGTARVFGNDVATSPPSNREKIGYLPGTLGLYDHLTAEEYFSFLSKMRQRNCQQTIRELCDRLSLDPTLRIKTMSKGTKQKVGLIQALMHSPSLLILDEPTSGLDPLIQNEVETILLEERDKGASVLLSSHVLSEVEKLASHVVILNDGQLLLSEPVESLPGHDIRTVTIEFDTPLDPAVLSHIKGFRLTSCDGKRITGTTVGSQSDLMNVVLQHGFVNIESPQPSLDEMFRHLVGQNSNNQTKES